MLEQLRIQCPSCGIVLDVRNSKHEAVKQITCPNCQKQLAVDFQEEIPAAPSKPLGVLYYGEMRIELQEGINQIALPACDAMELKVVRLNDGNNKCLVRALNDELSVLVNGESLGKEDEVALAVGDELRIGNTVLTYGKSQDKHEDSPHNSGTSSSLEPKPVASSDSKSKWPYVAIVLVAMVVCMFTIKHFNSERVETPQIEVVDTPSKFGKTIVPPITPPQKQGAGHGRNANEKTDKETPNSESSMYDLMQLAKKGDAEAQYKLGKYYVKRESANSVILGVNYLKEASRNGMTEAQNTLIEVINSLQRKADNGDSIAYQILMSIDNQ